MDALCPIRKEKVQEVKNKILRKLYETKELKEETVNKLVRSEDLRNMVCNFNLAETHKPKPLSNTSLTGKGTPKADLSIREEKIKEAKEKSQKGYYDNQEVFSKVAQRLMDLFGV
ncbi:MAG: hypothetical protein MUO91_08335 [candidate division Zixibacteria bacterium]|nr:hypothetical protein [candidate division Zixibacteria bacterium]